MQTKFKAQIAISIASIIWGITPIFIEISFNYLSPLSIMTFRFGIATIVLSMFVPMIKRRKILSLLKSKTCILVGWLISLGYLTSAIGQELTTPGIATLISTGYVIIVPFISWKLEGTNLTRGTLLLAIIAITGIFLTTIDGNWNNLSTITSIGIIYLMVAALSWGLNIVLSGKLLNREKGFEKRVDMLTFLYATVFHTFLPLLVLSFFTNPLPLSFPPSIFLILVCLGIFSTIITFSLYNWALARIGSIKTTFYLLIQIIVPFLYELIILKSSYSLWVTLGIILLLGAMVMIDFQKSSDIKIRKDQNCTRQFLQTLNLSEHGC